MWKTGFCIRGLSDFYPQANVQHWDVFHSHCGRIFLPKFSTEKFSTFHSPCGEKIGGRVASQCVRQCGDGRDCPAPARSRSCGKISFQTVGAAIGRPLLPERLISKNLLPTGEGGTAQAVTDEGRQGYSQCVPLLPCARFCSDGAYISLVLSVIVWYFLPQANISTPTIRL